MTQPVPPAQPPRPYADAVGDYALAGWPCILPVPPETKTPPPVGFTGAAGRDTTVEDLVTFTGTHPGHSIALRMPADVIGIDVDEYVKGQVTKHGATTLAEHLERWGPLPPTWTSTARGNGQSRIYFYRVPVGRYATKLTGSSTGDVEVIQRHHRYAVVWPSFHHDAGDVYRWYDPQGQVSTQPPKPNELPELPAAWVAGLAEGATDQGPASADRQAGEVLLDQLLEDWRGECSEIYGARLTAAEELAKSDAGSRHDTMTARVHHLVQLAAAGHTGVGHAVLELRTAWAALTAGEGREDELERMLLTSARKAVTVVGAHQVVNDPCMFAFGLQVPAPSPGGAGEGGSGDAPHEPIEPPRWHSVRQFLGTAAFDPNAGHDQALAEKVLERTWPVLRHTYDTGGWLLRVPDRWEPHGNLAGWGVAQVADLMPVGDPTAEKGSEPHERAKRRARLMSTAGSRAVAGKMGDLVAGGTHPAALRLSDLDADPEILWAGGVPWSLRASSGVLVPASIDPATPHMHAGGVTPEVRPTPLFDAFLAAVWPDEALRAWALRVLSITLTGYADRALPILLGETGRGKTQLVHLVMSVLGTYAHAANPKLLSAGSNEHDTIVFALKGRRLSFIDEAPSEAKVGQERLKQLTGGGELTARQMNQDPITFAPTHTFVLTANDEPLLTDPAVRSRSRLIPCEGDPELVRLTRAAIGHVSGPAWRSEAPGVLAMLMAEAAAWLADPTTAATAAAPESIRYLAENLGAEQDPVSVWLTEETEYFEAGTPSRELYQAFTASCLRNNLRRDAIPSETKWGRALQRRGYAAFHTRTGKRRQLRVRTGGFLPGMPAPDAGQTSAPIRDGLAPIGDGLVTGSQSNPSQPFPQVNPSDQPNGDGCDGLFTPYAHAQARPPAGGSNLDFPPTRHGETSQTAPDLRECDSAGADVPVTPAKPLVTPAKKAARKPKDPEIEARAASKRAQVAAAKREAAMAAVSGAHVELPALLTRDGVVRAVSVTDADALLATITGPAGAGELTVDVEHTGYPAGHVHYALRTVQLGDEHVALDLDPHDPAQADVVRRHLAAAAVLHAHSATADLVPLVDAGLVDRDSAWERMEDTAVLAKLADPASTGNDPNLKKVSAAMLGEHALSPAADDARAALFKAGKWLTDTEVTTPLERSGWAQVDPRSETMVRYAASDVLDDAAIARRLPRPDPAVLERERATQRMTARVTHTGIRLDGQRVEQLLAEHSAKRSGYAEQVRGYGIDNPGSNAQVGDRLLELGAPLPHTRTGKASVAKGVLETMTDAPGEAGDLVRAVLDYRHHNTAIVLFLEPYRELVRNGDGRARPTVYTLGADTGRMSCVRPNLQQMPREGGFRACITADPGHVLISADFASVEIRVAAALSQDPSLIRMLAEDRDMHGEIARLVWGPGFTKSDRYKAKRKVFGRIYGQGVEGMAKTDGAGEQVARAVIDAMDALTPGLTAWSGSVRDGIKSGRTKFQTYSGRVVHLPVMAPHAGPNYCIQGTARELLIDALMRWADTPWGGGILWPVHDEVVAMVPEADAEAATAALVECMATELFGVPIVAEASAPSFVWADSV